MYVCVHVVQMKREREGKKEGGREKGREEGERERGEEEMKVGRSDGLVSFVLPK